MQLDPTNGAIQAASPRCRCPMAKRDHSWLIEDGDERIDEMRRPSETVYVGLSMKRVAVALPRSSCSITAVLASRPLRPFPTRRLGSPVHFADH
jgi:hypothetical protein